MGIPLCATFCISTDICVSELDFFKGLSFTTISATGPNGGEDFCFFDSDHVHGVASIAIIHYSPDPNECAVIKKDQVCVLFRNTHIVDLQSVVVSLRFGRYAHQCTSGDRAQAFTAQFLDGTTDVTRTWVCT